jgi:type II secretory pathway component PulJ
MLGASSNQQGTSLIELMVGIAISLILLTGIISVVVRMSVAGGESVQGARLNQQLRGTLDTMSKDLQRAGYVDWWHAWDDDNGDGNPVDANDGATEGVLADIDGNGTVNILDFYNSALPAMNKFGQVSLYSINAAASSQAACTANCNCILFSFDLNEDGAQGVASGAGTAQNTDNRELFGYRLRDGAIETRFGAGTNTNSCVDGSWEDISEPNSVEITALNFGLTYVNAAGAGDSTVYPFAGTAPLSMGTTCTPSDDDGDGIYGEIDEGKCLWMRTVSIAVSGRLVDDNDVTLTLNSNVKIKNDYLQTSP